MSNSSNDGSLRGLLKIAVKKAAEGNYAQLSWLHEQVQQLLDDPYAPCFDAATAAAEKKAEEAASEKLQAARESNGLPGKQTFDFSGADGVIGLPSESAAREPKINWNALASEPLESDDGTGALPEGCYIVGHGQLAKFYVSNWRPAGFQVVCVDHQSDDGPEVVHWSFHRLFDLFGTNCGEMQTKPIYWQRLADLLHYAVDVRYSRSPKFRSKRNDALALADACVVVSILLGRGGGGAKFMLGTKPRQKVGRGLNRAAPDNVVAFALRNGECVSVYELVRYSGKRNKEGVFTGYKRAFFFRLLQAADIDISGAWRVGSPLVCMAPSESLKALRIAQTLTGSASPKPKDGVSVCGAPPLVLAGYVSQIERVTSAFQNVYGDDRCRSAKDAEAA